jgi:hypothetical protein
LASRFWSAALVYRSISRNVVCPDHAAISFSVAPGLGQASHLGLAQAVRHAFCRQACLSNGNAD